MLKTPTVSDELVRKALDQLAHLEASLIAGFISGQAFQTGVETLWACTAGLHSDRDFSDLMNDASKVARKLNKAPAISVFRNGVDLAITIRHDDEVRMILAKAGKVASKVCQSIDESVEYERGFAERLKEKGLERVA